LLCLVRGAALSRRAHSGCEDLREFHRAQTPTGAQRHITSAVIESASMVSRSDRPGAGVFSFRCCRHASQDARDPVARAVKDPQWSGAPPARAAAHATQDSLQRGGRACAPKREVGCAVVQTDQQIARLVAEKKPAVAAPELLRELQ
jgi:hypothetical protein